MKELMNCRCEKPVELLMASTTSETYNDHLNSELTMLGGIIYEDVNSKGETIEITAIKTEEYGYISGNSSIVKATFEKIASFLEVSQETKSLKFKIVEKTTKDGETTFKDIQVSGL